MATHDTALKPKNITPSFTVDDLQRSITFYERLGFAVDERWEENGVLLGVMLRAGDYTLGLSQDDWKKGRERQKGVGVRVHIGTTQNVDELAARAKAAGVSLDTEPYNTPWNSRAFDVTDPSGFKLSVSTEVVAA